MIEPQRPRPIPSGPGERVRGLRLAGQQLGGHVAHASTICGSSGLGARYII